jgi:secondary thiamine-phosphate synthase enzyme
VIVEKSNCFTLNIESRQSQELILITDKVKELVSQSKIQNGMCFLFIPHVTAALTINSYLDPNTAVDLDCEVDRIIPTRVNFHHILDTPADASAHIKASFIGSDLLLIIKEGELLLGKSQGIFFWEYDGPRDRNVIVKIIDC